MMFNKRDTIHARLCTGNLPVLRLMLHQLAVVLPTVNRRTPCIRFFYRVHPPAFWPTKVNLVGVIVTTGQIFLPFCRRQFNCRAPAGHWLPYGRAS